MEDGENTWRWETKRIKGKGGRCREYTGKVGDVENTGIRWEMERI